MRKIFYLLVLVCFFSCVNNNQQEKEVKYNIFNKNLITANKELVRQDARQIENYIKRRNWNMTDMGSGLSMMILEHGTGDSIKHNPNIKVDYKIELLDGTVCYSSQNDGRKDYVFGNSEMESGLIKGFSKLRHGDKAVFIMPCHLMKGLIGDLNKIPVHSTVVYYVEIL